MVDQLHSDVSFNDTLHCKQVGGKVHNVVVRETKRRLSSLIYTFDIEYLVTWVMSHVAGSFFYPLKCVTIVARLMELINNHGFSPPCVALLTTRGVVWHNRTGGDRDHQPFEEVFSIEI